MDVREPLALDLPAVEEVARMPAGFRAGAVAAGIKASGRPDLGVLATTDGRPVPVAAMFTANRLPASPVIVSQDFLAKTGGHAAAVLSTSGCANAATGVDGDEDQYELADSLAQAIGAPVEQMLAISTGLIGTRLPGDRIHELLFDLVPAGLSPTDDGLAALAEQICTTDTRTKAATVRLELGGDDGAPRQVTVSGIAKGVGMIHPRMATMLALVLTDAAATPPLLDGILRPAVERTWNQLTVDGDTSTNDTVFLLASGGAGSAVIVDGSPEHDRLAQAVMAVARSLARQQAADGEGATTLINCQISGAEDDRQARAAARSVVASSLVKAAVHGRDPNWGRIAAAIGNAEAGGQPVAVSDEKLAIGIAGVRVYDGKPIRFDRAALSARMDSPELLIRADLGQGDGTGEAFGCDLTEQYVVENSAYST